MKKTLLLTALVVFPLLSEANSGKSPKQSEKARVKFTLTPEATFTDLATSSGKGDYKREKKVSQFDGRVKIPLTSTTLAVTDATTAAAAKIHLEFLRDGTAYNDCTLAFVKNDDAAPSSYSFRVYVKSVGKKSVKGSCTQGVPAVQSTDAVVGYAEVNGARVDFLKK